MSAEICRVAEAERVRCVASTYLPTRWGRFKTIGFVRERLAQTLPESAIALSLGELRGEAPLVRIHSECITSELLGSLRCDCGSQLELALQSIGREGRGLVIYEHQEGRGIGLMSKLRAYALQDQGLDTVEANHALGMEADYRDFALPTRILQWLGVARVRLLSNNPNKVRALQEVGIEVVARLSCEAVPTPHSVRYLRAKKEKLGHDLQLLACTSAAASYGEGAPERATVGE